MTLYYDVADEVRLKRRASILEIQQAMPDRTLLQVSQAAKNAARLGLIQCVERVRIPGTVRGVMGVYAPAVPKPSPQRVCSVWDYAQKAAQ